MKAGSDFEVEEVAAGVYVGGAHESGNVVGHDSLGVEKSVAVKADFYAGIECLACI